MSSFLYVRDHEGFKKLTMETHQNKWFAHQIELIEDRKHINGQLSESDLEFYKFVFTFLGMAEKLVNFNIDEVVTEFKSHDIDHYYTEQKAMENIHGETYTNILNILFHGDMSETFKYADSIIQDPALMAKIAWLQSKVRGAKTRAKKVLIFLLIEGIFFISSFYSISLLRVRGLMPGACMANNYISRDELLHTTAASLLYNTMTDPRERPSAKWIYRLFRSAVDVEYDFIHAKGQNVTLLDTGEIKQFLQATADRILKSIGLDSIYGATTPKNCPLTYMTGSRNTNFFEQENTEYCMVVKNDL